MMVEEKVEWKAAQKPVAIVGAAFITVDGEFCMSEWLTITI